MPKGVRPFFMRLLREAAYLEPVHHRQLLALLVGLMARVAGLVAFVRRPVEHLELGLHEDGVTEPLRRRWRLFIVYSFIISW